MSQMNIKFNVLDCIYKRYAQEFSEASDRVLKSAWYILGKEVASFEEEFAQFC